MNNKGNGIIGRKNEQDTLRYIMEEKEAKMVAVYGRRRVGKTFLVRRFFNDQFDFYFTGSFETPASIQLALFASQLRQYSGEDIPVPKSWFDAFELFDQGHVLLGIRHADVFAQLTAGHLGVEVRAFEVEAEHAAKGIEHKLLAGDGSVADHLRG